MSDMPISHREAQNLKAQAEDLKQEQESRLQRLRNEYKRRESEIREAGSAAVNHIKRSTDNRIDEVRDGGEQRIRQENENHNRSYADLKRRAIQQNENLDSQMRITEERAKDSIEKTKRTESNVMQQTNEKLRDFIERQNEMKARVREDSNAEITETRKTQNAQVMAHKAQGQEQIRKTDAQQRQELENLKARNRELYAETKEQTNKRIDDVTYGAEQKLKQDRELKNRSLTELQRKYKESINVTQTEGERRLAEIKKAEQRRFEDTQEHSLTLNEQIRTEYGRESQRVQVEGEADVRGRQVAFDRMKQRQLKDNDAQLKDLTQGFSAQQLKAHKEYEIRMQEEANILDSNLREQRQGFKERYDVNDKTHKSTLHNQKETYLRELFKQKQRFDTKFGKESARADDPFYRLKSFDARLEENTNAYVLKARVPAYERDSVDIVVKDNKIVLSAKRAYQENLADDTGGRTSTNSYQTYRQEFTLDIPVEAKKTFRKVEDDGSITIIAPKKGYDTKA